MPPLRLRILPVLDLHPTQAAVFVDSHLPLGDDSLQIHSANFLKQRFAIVLHVLRVHHPGAVAANQFLQHVLALHQRALPQIFPIKPEEIERVQHRLALATQQIIEAADAVRIQAYNLTVDNGVLHRKLAESGSERREAEVIKVAGDQLALAVLYVRERAETVLLQLEDVVGIVERVLDEVQSHWSDARKHDVHLPNEQHISPK